MHKKRLNGSAWKKLFFLGIVAGTLCMGGFSVKAAREIKELSVQEMQDIEYNGNIYSYVLQRQYETSDKEEKIDFQEKVDGYKLSEVSYEVIETVLQKELVEEKKDYKNLQEKKESDIKEHIEIGENTYTLKEVTWSEKANKEHVSYTLDLGYSDKEPAHPDVYEYKYTSPVTKKEQTVKLPFRKMESTEPAWVDGFTAIVTFHNLDGMYFTLGGHEFLYNENSPGLTASDYKALVKMLGYDTGKYQLNSAVWSGAAYTSSSGERCRNAVATGKQYAARYKAIYEDDIETGKTYTAHAVYTCEVEVPADEKAPTYIIQATGYYQDASVWTNILTFITEHKPLSIATLAVFIILALISIAIVVTEKKKKNSDNNNTNETDF